jgi:hypothetical protein
MIKIKFNVENELTWQDMAGDNSQRRKFFPGDTIELFRIEPYLQGKDKSILVHVEENTRIIRMVRVPNGIFEYVTE